ncbi:hypothetical protein EW146_g8901 [Bondarzewia mesenterica]|uniref:CRAL-TRIO domain-containing protein n=1 Tax=Bondarzewia mesenterica TaxID=1095465 RepID=A0A4S4LAU0_9AGAM|nr:hypothetical protein EW146_g8901 [Bondarzewia mesenterica]
MTRTTQIITSLAPDTTVKPVHTYTEEQTEQIKALREHANTLCLPGSDEYHAYERKWLDRPDTIPRYMRAAKWKLDDGKKRIKGTLEWRREFKPDLIPPDELLLNYAWRRDAEQGHNSSILNGFDVDGRPIIYMRPGRENTETSPRQLRHLVWVLERAKDLMPPGQESLMIIVDYKSTTLRTNPSISIARKVLTILQQHYVETLGRAIVVNLPILLSFFYKGIAPFLDPVTRDKMRFNPDLFELVPKSQLDADFGGEYELEWDFESYWAQMVEHCGIAPDGTRVQGKDTPALTKQPEQIQESSLTPPQSPPESETSSLSPSTTPIASPPNESATDKLDPTFEPEAATVAPVSS